MSGWQKIENNVNEPFEVVPAEMQDEPETAESEKTPEPVPETVVGESYTHTPESAENTDLPKAPVSSQSSAWETSGGNEAVLSPRRYTAGGRRRGRHRFASLLGLIVLLLAAVGLVSLVVAGIRAIEKAQDDTALRTELDDFLNPVMQYNPTAFTAVNDSKQDALLLAAIYRVTDAERIRQLCENTSVCAYELDDLGRMLIPIKEIETSYAVLFGPDAKIYNHTIGDEGLSFTIEYDPDTGYYHIPSVSSSSMYVPVIDTLKKKGDTVIVRVGFVLGTKIGRDKKGNLVDPTADMAEYFQLYTVKRTESGNGWYLVSVQDDGGTTSTTTAATTATGSETASGSTTAAAAAATTKAAATTTTVTTKTTAAK